MRVVHYFPDGIETIITIEGGLIGMRLDQVLQMHYREASRAQLVKLIKSKDLEIKNLKGTLKPSLKMLKGYQVRLFRPRANEPKFNKNIEILFEDEELYIMNKPSGAPVHPAGRYVYETITVYYELEKNMTLYPVHRLDRETSGVLVTTKTAESASVVSTSIQNHNVEKLYLARVSKEIPFKYSKVKLPMGTDTTSVVRLKQAITKDGVPSITEVLKISPTLCLVQLHTGRQHQIRVILKMLDAPIEGDSLYGLTATDDSWDKKTKGSLERLKLGEEVKPDNELGLHCFQMKIDHPKTNKLLTLQCFPDWITEEEKEKVLRTLEEIKV